MEKIRIDKDALAAIITTNREAHQKIFDEAVDGYKQVAEARLAEAIERVRTVSLERVSVTLPAPTNHTADYDRVLKMLELHMEQSVVLSEADVAQYVMDDWGWRATFLTSNSLYSKTAEDELAKG